MKDSPLLYMTCPLGTRMSIGALFAAILAHLSEQNWWSLRFVR